MQETLGLRPLGVGDIVDRVFAIYRSRPLAFLAIAAIPYLFLALVISGLTVAFGGTLGAIAPLLGGDFEGALAVLGSTIGALLLYLLLVAIAALATSLIQSASLVDAAAARYLGKDRTVGASLGVGLRAWPRLFAMGVLAFLGVVALWTALTIAMALLGQWWAFILLTLGGLFATGYLAASWMVSPAVAILEDAGPVASLRRAWRLSEGGRWRILGLIVLLVVLEIVLSTLLSTVLVTSLVTEQGVQFLLQVAVNTLAPIAWAPVYWGTFAVLYYDLRVRKEALDLQLAAEALPRASS